jgi:EAL domain-containing protein (putative c-di-GMP-specific phosphodiesterase class I)
VWPPAAAALLLAALIALRFIFPEPDGIMLLAVVPIILLGMMLGPSGGVGAALVASVAYLVWAATEGHPDEIAYVDHPLAFFALGGLSGFFARGVLGDYDLREAMESTELRGAMDRDELVMHFQPIVRREGAPLGVEALVRWQHPKRGLLPPGQFVPSAESDEQTIWELTARTLELSIREAVGGRIGDGIVAVNISPVCLRRDGLPSLIDSMLDRAGLPGSRLMIEVTEAAIAAEDAEVAEILARVKGVGVGMIAIDDFGVGHSSLSRLARLPIDALKIDRSLIAGLGQERTREVVAGIVQLAHALKMPTIAEGVEDEATRVQLGEMRCDAVQGFHLGRPLPSEELGACLKQRGMDQALRE